MDLVGLEREYLEPILILISYFSVLNRILLRARFIHDLCSFISIAELLQVALLITNFVSAICSIPLYFNRVMGVKIDLQFLSYTNQMLA
jgi:hypothetical protein